MPTFLYHIRGQVQGVGFRPFVYQLAEAHSLKGEISNTSQGVELTLEGPESALNAFEAEFHSSLPPLARVDQMTKTALDFRGYAKFSISPSAVKADAFTPVPPDTAICADCRRELFDPSDRRYRYPFINCTNCGPRFTIIRDTPYDRPLTTMAGFALCPQCQAEYENPLDRRFHTQPVACPVCGPQLWYQTRTGEKLNGEGGLAAARRLIQEGGVLAVKGLGGFHLACDPFNPGAVERLRSRKKRSDKPLALMAFSLDQIRPQACLGEDAIELLTSRQAPICVLTLKPSSRLDPAIAPGQNTVGVMLAYTPLHLLLLEPSPEFPDLLVMTSGNVSEEPIAFEDADALERLAPLADGFLLHNREIHARMDDSVIAPALPAPVFLRRSRGFAPDPLTLPQKTRPILGTGAEVKNTFCLAHEAYAFVSPHIGDMENAETLASFEEGIRHYERLFRFSPEIIACDLHPDYLATQYAVQRAAQASLPLLQVQHHHAHLAACLAENGRGPEEKAIGLIFDGTGLGTDGQIWGGEVLYGGYTSVERVFHLEYVPLPGGDSAIRKPARMALAWLHAAGIPWEADLPPVTGLTPQERAVVQAQVSGTIPTVQTSSLGRLFDAVAALTGIRQEVTYEGQAAIELEALADDRSDGCYPMRVENGLWNASELIRAITEDVRQGVPPAQIAGRFHRSIAEASRQICRHVRGATGCDQVALAGGVWQNRLLLRLTVDKLRQDGYTVLSHQQLPPNDGSLSLGQVMVAANTL